MNHPEQDEPVYWFVLLEKAIHRGDFDAAARAKRELERLGVSVTYRAQTTERKRRQPKLVRLPARQAAGVRREH